MTCNKPSNTTSGDLLIALTDTQNNSVTFSPPSGWTLIGQPTSPGNGSIASWYKVAGGSEPSSYAWTVTAGGGGRWGVIIQRVTGANTSGTIVDVTGAMPGSTGNASLTIPGVTTTAGNDLVFAAYHFRGTDPAATAMSAAGMANALSSPLVADSGTSFSAFMLSSVAQPSAGSSGTVAASMTGSGSGISSEGFLFAIEPVPSTPPTASFTLTTSGLQVSVDGSGSSGNGGATITGYDWDWGDSSLHGSGSTASHTYSTGGTYTVKLTVTDSNSNTGNQSQSVTVIAPSPTSVPVSVSVSTGWTASTGTVLACISDADPTTYITSSGSPSGQELDVGLGPLTAPSTGQPLKLFIECDKQLATAGTFDAQIYEGATLRSSVSGTSIADGSGSSVTAISTVSFPWSDVQNVSTGGWQAGLTLKLQVSAS